MSVMIDRQATKSLTLEVFSYILFPFQFFSLLEKKHVGLLSVQSI
jgi:hypothetical protein